MSDVEVADAAVERACQRIYREFEGYWPNESERARIRAALASTIEVDFQAENECLRELLRLVVTEETFPADHPGLAEDIGYAIGLIKRWTCPDCECVNGAHEAFCYRCGACPEDDDEPSQSATPDDAASTRATGEVQS